MRVIGLLFRFTAGVIRVRLRRGYRIGSELVISVNVWVRVGLLKTESVKVRV